jgi:hypothetical protein
VGAWQQQLERLVRFAGQLPEPLDSFFARPPSDQPWPEGLPIGTALAEFYGHCDGGELAVYHWLEVGELPRETKELRDWLDQIGDDEAPEDFVVLAQFSDGTLVWDPARDRVRAFLNGAVCWDETGLSLASFLDDLFSAGRMAGELADLWAEALEWVEQRT